MSVLWILRVDVPEAERIELGVTAREKMSVLCASSIVWVVRYCFDIVTASFEYLGVWFLEEEVFLVDVVNKAEALEALAGLKKIS